MSAINVRLRLLVDREAPTNRRFAYMEQLTGVPGAVWAAWWRKGGAPGGVLIEAAGRAWPEFVLWLCTGSADSFVAQLEPLSARPAVLAALMQERDAAAERHEDVQIFEREIARAQVARIK